MPLVVCVVCKGLDHTTRSIRAACLNDTNWLTGPAFLSQPVRTSLKTAVFGLVDPEQDKEVHPQVTALTTTTHNSHLGSQHFEILKGSLPSHILSQTYCMPFNRDHSTIHHQKHHNLHSSMKLMLKKLIALGPEETSPISPLRMLDSFIHKNGILRVG